MRTQILDVGFDDITMDAAVAAAMEKMHGSGAPEYVVTPNPEIVWQCRGDAVLRDAVNAAFLVLPDGVGIMHGAKIMKTPLTERVPGIDFASALFGEMAKAGMSVYLLGAKPGVAEKAAENLKKEHEGLVIAGTRNGYFADDGDVVSEINAARPDLLVVCLGSPKQEYFMSGNAGRIKCGLMAGLGGSLDVFAGNVTRAPEKWRKLGLEWLYRLLKEPSRIKRMIKLPLFLLEVVRQRLSGK